jgi:glycosyltransferase involved in cell wall biosynthesis
VKPTATIIIPTFNRSQIVHRAIDSALGQTFPCEVLVVDHGSSDGTPERVAEYGDRIRYIRRQVDSGPVACWRDGAENATGDFVHFTYDDDWLQPTFMEECIDAFDPGTAFVYCRATLRNEALEGIGVVTSHPAGRHSVSRLAKHLLLTKLTISPGCALFRRGDVLKNLLPEVPGASGTYGKQSGVGEDLLLFLLTSLDYGSYVHLPTPLADFLAHPGSITVDAQSSGRQEQLIEAYATARRFYLGQPGAQRTPRGVSALAFRLRWWLESNSPWNRK